MEKKSNSKLLETFEVRRHVMAFANQTQRQDKLGTGKKNPNGKIQQKPLNHIILILIRPMIINIHYETVEKRCRVLCRSSRAISVKFK